jgi:hypothetical protein
LFDRGVPFVDVRTEHREKRPRCRHLLRTSDVTPCAPRLCKGREMGI